ncbi:MAG: hypothetical protein ACI92A_002656, partial [Candidatus Paceibacteria bacterium]
KKTGPAKARFYLLTLYEVLLVVVVQGVFLTVT